MAFEYRIFQESEWNGGLGYWAVLEYAVRNSKGVDSP
jgi:hypothetical protein